MADVKTLFKDLKLTAVNLRKENPNWSDSMIIDYMKSL